MEETRLQAIAILEQGDEAVRELLARLSPGARTRRGIGGGDWSVKDLIGHLASWQEHALEALEAWDKDLGAPIDKALYARGTNVVNAEAVAAKAKLSWARVAREADANHERLVAAIATMSDERWERPATTRGRKPLGHRMGQILGGPAGGFRHAQAHLKDLKAFVDERTG